MGKVFRFAGRELNTDEVYYIAYAGGKRELCAVDERAYKKAMSLPPGEAQRVELRKIGAKGDPNVFPVTGAKLREMIHDLHAIPMFDKFFDKTKTIQITDEIMFEAMKMKNYDLAKGR